MFRKSAAYYDLLYREIKDYADEALKLHYLLGKLSPAPRRLLDVGCGSGEHALYLHRHFGYEVDGIDIEPDLVAIAAAKLPQGDFSEADMRRFSLPRRYHAILCLFSSIGYVETYEGLEQAFGCMNRHLEAGGWLLCEPWATPERWTPGQIDVAEAADPEAGLTLTRTRVGSTEGKVSVLTIEYDLAGPDGAGHFQEVHRLGLFSDAQMLEALSAAGFEPKRLEHGPQGTQGTPLIIARKRGHSHS